MSKRNIKNLYNLNVEYGVMTIDSPKFGIFEVKFDLEDYEFIKGKQWCIAKCGTNRDNYYTFYAQCKNGHMHKLLMNTPKGMHTDHKNGDDLDNRKENLRICTRAENGYNRKNYATNTSGHKGVCWYPYNNYNKWKVHIRKNGKLINLGYYDTYEEAVIVREKAELEYFGNFNRDKNNIGI